MPPSVTVVAGGNFTDPWTETGANARLLRRRYYIMVYDWYNIIRRGDVSHGRDFDAIKPQIASHNSTLYTYIPKHTIYSYDDVVMFVQASRGGGGGGVTGDGLNSIFVQ